MHACGACGRGRRLLVCGRAWLLCGRSRRLRLRGTLTGGCAVGSRHAVGCRRLLGTAWVRRGARRGVYRRRVSRTQGQTAGPHDDNAHKSPQHEVGEGQEPADEEPGAPDHRRRLGVVGTWVGGEEQQRPAREGPDDVEEHAVRTGRRAAHGQGHAASALDEAARGHGGLLREAEAGRRARARTARAEAPALRGLPQRLRQPGLGGRGAVRRRLYQRLQLSLALLREAAHLLGQFREFGLGGLGARHRRLHQLLQLLLALPRGARRLLGRARARQPRLSGLGTLRRQPQRRPQLLLPVAGAGRPPGRAREPGLARIGARLRRLF
mmetsp:Transcript_40965/g.116029  ORF Transcript_40965/g.116029 Transcript_40965/m.116029 type:complete len:324 (-) Transcript_40965:365-1336(-)